MGLTWVVQERSPVSLSGLMDLEETKNNSGTFPSAVLQAYLHGGQVFTEGPQALGTGPPHWALDQYLMNGGMKKSRA